MPVTGVNTDALESGIRSAIAGSPAGDDSASAPSNGLLESIKALFPDTKPSGTLPGAPAAAQTPARPVDPDSVQGTVQGTIVEAARRHGVDPSVMLGLAQSESGFDPDAVSPTGATGVFQFTRRTAKEYGVDRHDAASSADGAARYMKELLARHNGDVHAALRDYKGVAVGGATEGNVRDTLGKIERYRTGGVTGGFTAPASSPSAPPVGDDAAMQRYLDDTSDLTAPAQPAATQTSQPYIDFGAVPSAPAAEPTEPGSRLQSLLTSLGIQPAHGNPAQGNEPPPMRTGSGLPSVAPSQYTENISRGTEAQADAARGGLAAIIGNVNSALRMGGAAIVKSVAGQEGIDAMKVSLGLAREADDYLAPRIAADKSGGPFPNDPVQNAGAQILEGAVKTLTGGLGQTAFPKTSEAIEQATSTGEPALDRALQSGGSIGLFATPLAPIAIGAGVAGTGVRVAEGEETPLAGIGDVATTMVGLKGFKAASELQGVAKRIVANVLVSEGMEAAGSAVHGQAPTAEGMVGAAVGGVAFGVASHPHVEGRQGGEGPSTPEEAFGQLAKDIQAKIESGTDKEVAAAMKANVDAKAHEAATSPLNERPEPTPAQTEAGNYKKGHVSIQGLDMSIENPQGSVRSGTGSAGQPWQTTLKDHYGYIKGTTGADGDHVDTFIGPDPKSDKVFVVDQVRPASEVAAGANREGMDAAATAPEFDEHKVVLGAKSKDEATEIYKRNYSDDPTARIGAVSEATMPEFKRWLKDGDTTRPFTEFEHGARSESAATEPARNESIDLGQPSEGISEPSAGDIGGSERAAENPIAGRADVSGDAEPAPEGVGEAGDHSVTREPITLHDVGHDTHIRVGDTKMPAKYALVEARDVQLSHDPTTFARNPDYVGENQNNYDSDKAMQASVERGVADTDWDTIHSQTKTSTEGPTTIDEFGQAAGGNGRGMIQKGVYAVRPDEAKNAAIQNAPRFGLDAAVAARMSEPMIVRVQPEVVSKSVESRRNIAAHNASVTKSRTPVVDGVDLAKRLTPENKSALAEALAGVERMSDLNKKDALARPIIKVLRDAGQITHTNQAEYITPDGTLTHKGSETVEGATLGMAIPDAALVERLPAGFRQKLAENLPTLGAVESTKGWELHDNLARVVDYNEARQAFVDRGGVKSMYDKQGSLLPEAERAPELTSEDHTLLALLEDPKRTQFKEFMKAYAAKAEEARSGAIDFSGEPMTRERAFTEAAEALQIKERTGIAGYFDKTKAEDEAYIKEHLGKSLSMNIDPVLGARIMRRIAGWIADGVHDTAQLSARALEEWGDRIKADLDELLDGARTMFVANKGEGLRGGLADLAEAYMRKPEQTTMKRVIGTFQGNVEAREIDLRNLDRDILARVPDGGFTGTKAAAYKQERLAAMKVFWEAGGGGDELFSEHTMNETLAQWAAQSSAKNAPKYQDALNLTDHEKLLAREMGARQMRNGRAAVEAGVLDKMVDNYAHNVWEHDPKRAKSLIAMASSVEFDPTPSVTLHKIFANTFEGEQAGFTAKEGHTSLLRSLIENERALGNAIDTRIAIHDMMQSKEADGQPSVIIGGDALPIKGEAEDAGVLRAQPLKALLIRPNSLGEVDRELYKQFDHRAMRKWKWVASDLNGKPILMRGDAWVHKDAWSKMNNFLGRSKVRDWEVPDNIPLIGGTHPLNAIMKAQSMVKSTILQGFFHQFHLDTHAMFHNTNPFGLPDIDFEKRPDLRAGVEHGLTLMMTKAYREGVAPGGLFHYVPGYDETMGRYVQWFFGNHLPRLKASAYEDAWAQNQKHYAGDLLSGTITKDQLMDITANQVNAAYGGINTKYPGGSAFGSPTARDIMSLCLLAPDFLEARMKSIGQSVRPYGHAQRMALLRGALYTSLTAQATNVIFGDDHKLHLDHPFQVLIGGRWYGPRTEVGDIVHLFQNPTSFAYTRISPIGHALTEVMSGRNDFGEKVGTGEAALDVLKSWAPIPLQGITKSDKHWKEQTVLAKVTNGLLNSVGISNFENRSGLESFVRERFFATLPQTKRTGTAQTIADAKSELRDAYRAGKPGKVAQLQQKYGFTEKQMKAAERQSKESPLVYDFGRLTLAEMAQAFDDHVTDIQALPASDRSRLQVLFGHRITNAALAEMPEATKAEYRQKYNLPE